MGEVWRLHAEPVAPNERWNPATEPRRAATGCVTELNARVIVPAAGAEVTPQRRHGDSRDSGHPSDVSQRLAQSLQGCVAFRSKPEDLAPQHDLGNDPVQFPNAEAVQDRGDGVAPDAEIAAQFVCRVASVAGRD